MRVSGAFCSFGAASLARMSLRRKQAGRSTPERTRAGIRTGVIGIARRANLLRRIGPGIKSRRPEEIQHADSRLDASGSG